MTFDRVTDACGETLSMIIQLCPALLDWIVFLVLFAALYGAGERNMSGLQCAWLGGIPQITYMISSLVVGVLLSRRNARTVLLAATVLSTVLGIACLNLTAFTTQMLALGLFGVAIALFFNAFQTFMRGETAPGGLADTVGGYTVAWSLGSSMGFLSSGTFYRLGPLALSAVVVLVGGGVLTILLTYRRRPYETASADEHIEQPLGNHRRMNPAYVWVAWCLIFTGMFVQRPLQSLFPALCARQGISPALAGLPLFLHMLIQGIWGYHIRRYASWRYRRTPLVAAHGFAVLLMVLVTRNPAYAFSACAVALLGFYTGYVYFTAVYYASNSGRRSLNIGVNECLVGLGSFAGLFACQWWMKRSGEDSSMYAVCAWAMVLALGLQVLLASLRVREPADSGQ